MKLIANGGIVAILMKVLTSTNRHVTSLETLSIICTIHISYVQYEANFN